MVLFLASCSMWPFGSKKTAADTKNTAKVDSTQKQKVGEPKPGDINVVDGVEYIYAKNRRYMSSP